MATGTTTVGFEEKLWLAADKLRSNMDAAEYKHVVLGLIFLKYVSDSFEEKYQQLVAEGYGDEEDRDEYLAENGYVNDITSTRLHHEIYMSDARKVAPEKWKTVIRHPIKKA